MIASDICEMIAATQNHLLRLDEVYFFIKYLAGLSTWQAWVIANQVYRKYVSSGNDEQFNKDSQIIQRLSMHIPMPRKERDFINVYKRRARILLKYF